MSDSFSLSSKTLLAAMGMDCAHYDSEGHMVYDACHQLSTHIYKEIGNDRRQSEEWHVDEKVIVALQDCLSINYSETYARPEIAYTLVKCGVRNDEVIANLNPWLRLAFRWCDNGIDAEHVFKLLETAGVAARTGAAVETVNSWVNDPYLPFKQAYPDCYVRKALLGERLVVGYLSSDEFWPEHDTLFNKFAQSCIPSVTLDSVSQDLKSDGNSHNPKEYWEVLISYQNAPFVFKAEAYGSRVDTASVVKSFNLFMRKIGRTENVYQMTGGQDRGDFLIADSTHYPSVAHALYIPIGVVS